MKLDASMRRNTRDFGMCQACGNMRAADRTCAAPDRARRRYERGAESLKVAILAFGVAAAAAHGSAVMAADGVLDGSDWSPLGSGIAASAPNSVQAVMPYGDALIVAGTFQNAGGGAAINIAAWDGIGWSSLGEGVIGGGAVALGVYDGELYVGGLFHTAGGAPASRIAKWNGTEWSALGDGADAAVRAMIVYEGELIVGGEFSTIGGVAAQRIAKWNGVAWSPLGGGVTDAVYAGTVESLAVYQNELIVGGLFDHAGGVPANSVARWNGSGWTALGAGVNGETFNRHVYALSVHQDALYAGGSFSVAGGAPANRIARWDGMAWSSLGDGLDGAVRSIATYGGQLAAGGVFHNAGGEPAGRIARWDGNGWSTFGTGMDDTVSSLALFQGQLIAGGLFTQAGGAEANYVAAWGEVRPDPVFSSGFDPLP